ncbi:DUF2917 domain-containing protein [Azohydromonas lata]|uniref:DUF2917 domain-containing protein n=1 Tax=Azohydromonas lata TaxID=45677 RepID=A0ABU5IPM9_9BURK|nr:DUF2917 domain-containing protein [Azohydromonas lata]MDZ5460849.1 DUF2917 domain-containing protein [Azohydromonas lata]
MKTQILMPETQRSQGAAAPVWTLSRRQARRLAATRHRRFLRVLEGELWVTPSAGARSASEDLWLRAGQRLELPAGVEFVAEGWRDSRFELLLAPGPVAAWSAQWLRPLLSRVQRALRGRGAPLAAG